VSKVSIDSEKPISKPGDTQKSKIRRNTHTFRSMSSTVPSQISPEIFDRYRPKKDVSAHLSIVDVPPDVKIDLLILTVKEPELLAVFELLQPLTNQSHIIGCLFEHSMYYFGRFGR
jgi:hypothetical protein